MFKKLLLTIAASFIGLALAGNVFASNNLSIQLEQPKTPTNQDTFGITFVALDVNNNPLTVTCYKKGPTDGDFTQFGSPITLSSGGNTDNCQVDSNVINTTGTFQFYAVVSNGSETAQSETVSVDHETGGPDTPTNYSKDHPSACTYVIHFTSANDNGKTAKIEVYRSTSTTFSVDASTRVYSVAIGSDTSASYTDTVSDCNATYYYAVRAFDTAGNGSGVVGDSQTVTIPNTTANSQTAGGAIPVVTSSVTSGEPTVAPSQTQTTDNKGVLGAKVSPTNPVTSSLKKYGLWAFLVLCILAAILFLKKRTKKSSR